MQDTGIIRRIDELGRVVIPKELRKKLRIKEGDPLEIYSNKDEMVLKKYSPLSDISSRAQAVADGIYGVIEKLTIITDNTQVVATSMDKNKELIGCEITLGVERAIDDRKSVILSRSDGGTTIPVVKDSELNIENQIIVPIVANGDCYGSIILIDKDQFSRFTMQDVKLARLGASFLSTQFED